MADQSNRLDLKISPWATESERRRPGSFINVPDYLCQTTGVKRQVSTLVGYIVNVVPLYLP